MTLRTGTGVAAARAGNLIMRKLLLIGTALIVTLPAGAAVRYVRAGIGIGPAFGPWGYGEPYYYGAYPVATHPNAGQVRLDTKAKSAQRTSSPGCSACRRIK